MKNKAFFISILILLSGCTDYDLVEEATLLSDSPVTSGQDVITTRTAVAINKCIDAYVVVGGYSSYKGTHCWIEYVEFGEYPYEPEEYDPGGFISGGGDFGTKEDPTDFIFERLTDLYGSASSLNLLEKQALNAAIGSFINHAPVYAELHSELVRQKIQISFGIDSALIELGAGACFYKDEDGYHIDFQSQNRIDFYALTEELIHLCQKAFYYGDQMTNTYKNYEFEAKLFQDLTNFLSSPSESGPYFVVEMTASSSDIHNWVRELIEEQKKFTYSNVADFQSMCGRWNGYPGEVLPSFIPKLILRYFSKARPEHL